VGGAQETTEASEPSGPSEDEDDEEEDGLLSPVGSISSLRRRAGLEGLAITGTSTYPVVYKGISTIAYV